jgi:N-acetylglucosamine-6-sulfatase
VRIGTIVCLVVVLIAQAIPLAASPPVAAATPPNIVVVMVDDMDARMVDDLPRLQELLVERGLSFSSFYVAAPVCCPSRAAFLRGQYPHNTGVFANGPPHGGVSAFRNNGNEESNVATWLQDAGYRTALIGKYLNDYEDEAKRVPRGWNTWFAYAGKGKYTNYLMSDKGKVREYGKKKQKKHYQTDVVSRKGVQFIASTGASQPLFLFLSPSAPHEPATPAGRHKKARVTRGQAPRVPSFNEADMSDKPSYWSNNRSLDGQAIKNIDSLYIKQQRAMFAVEDLIADVMAALEQTGRLENTYLFFLSDNGLHHGEHRIHSEKNTPFEESIRSPLLVIGPGVPAGVEVDAMTSNIDLGPTFAELAGIAAPDFVDGRSLVPMLDGSSPSGWREAVLSELLNGPPSGGFTVLRSGPYALFAYGSGTRELYDLDADSYQPENIIDTASPALVDELEAQFDALADCGSDGPSTCQQVDGGN